LPDVTGGAGNDDMIVGTELLINLKKQGVAGPADGSPAPGSALNRAFLLFMAGVFCYKVLMYKNG
jgi:hypothetical protein